MPARRRYKFYSELKKGIQTESATNEFHKNRSSFCDQSFEQKFLDFINKENSGFITISYEY